MFIDYLETERLIFEPIHEKMSPPELYRYCGPDNENVDALTEHIVWDTHSSILDSMKVLSEMREDWVSGETAHYYLTHKEDLTFAGAASFDIDYNRNQAEIGVWLRKDYWGRELATERAFALMEIGFELFELSSIRVSTSDTNEKSKQSIEKFITKAGGEKCGTIPDAHCTESGLITDKVVYAVRKSEFEEAFDKEDSPLLRYQWEV
jgi:RimJ/RimL family protein N-acetyltransferase